MNNRIELCTNRKTLEKVYMYDEDRFLHTQVLGPTGTGKTSQVFTPMMVQDIVNNHAGVVLFDPKGDFAEDMYKLVKEQFPERNLVYIDPTDDNSPKYNPLQGDLLRVIHNMIELFKPPFKVTNVMEKNNTDAIRIFLSNVLKLLYLIPDLVGDNGQLNILNFYNFISNKYNQARKECHDLLNNLQVLGNRISPEDREKLDLLEWVVLEYFDNTNGFRNKVSYLVNQIEDIIANPYLLKILVPEENETNLLNMQESISNGDIVIVNSKNTVLGDLSKIFGEFLLLEYRNSIFNRFTYEKEVKGVTNKKEIRPSFLYIDEFPTFSPIIIDLFTQGRSFRVGVHIVYQNRQMLEICGNVDTKNEATVIATNARNIIIFPGINSEDADHFSKEFYNMGREEIIYRPFGQIIYRIIVDKSITEPSIGLVQFIDQEFTTESIDKEIVKTGKWIDKVNNE